MNMKWCILALLFIIASVPAAESEPPYFSAQQLERECHKRSDMCFGVIYGVIGTLLSQRNKERMGGVICLPTISMDDVRVHFLSFAIDNREQIKDMLGGSALFTMLDNKYPCPEERLLRSAEAKDAYRMLKKEYGKK